MQATLVMIDRLFTYNSHHIADSYPATDYVPLRCLSPQNPGITIAAALQIGRHLAADGGLMRITWPGSTSMRPLRVPLRDFQPGTAIIRARQRMNNFHQASTGLSGFESDIAARHYVLKEKWITAVHGETRPTDIIKPLQIHDDRQLTGNVFEMHNHDGVLVAAGLTTPVTAQDGSRHVYADGFYYDPKLREQGLKPGFGLIGWMMQHYADLNYEAFYMGTWSPQRDHPYFYKSNLAKNTQVYDQGEWISAKAYLKALTP